MAPVVLLERGTVEGPRRTGACGLGEGEVMKRWAGVAALSYVLLLPLSLKLCVEMTDCLGSSSCRSHGLTSGLTGVILAAAADLFSLFTGGDRIPLAALGSLTLCLAVFLAVPVALGEGRPVRRPALLGATLATGLVAGLLLFGGEAAFGELFRFEATWGWALWVVPPLLAWGAWSVGFWRWSREAAGGVVCSRIYQRLLVGSLVAGASGVLDCLLAKDRPKFLAGFGGVLAVATAASALLFVGGVRFVLWVARPIKECPPVKEEPAEGVLDPAAH